MQISFVIPAHNEEELIARCLESIRREIVRSGASAEILVVDNNSTDRTAAIAATMPGVRVIPETKKGTGFARQAGFLQAKGDLIATIDADTFLGEGWIALVLQKFSGDAALVGLSGPYYFFDVGWSTKLIVSLYYVVAWIVHFLTLRLLKKGTVMIGGNAVMRRSALEKIGGFNTSITFYGDDTDMAKRLSAVGKVQFDMQLRVESSPRRIQKEGLLRTGFRYVLNHFWVVFAGKPKTKVHRDIRL